MIFLCFSSADRCTAAKSCLYHLKNFGFSTWYDYHELLLGDNKYEKNFKDAIKKNTYFIIIYSKGFFESPCALIEEDLIFRESQNRKIIIFPLLYNITFSELPIEYQSKVERLIYNEITEKTGCLNSVNQIIARILIDQLNIPNLDVTPQITLQELSEITDTFLTTILNEYLNVSSDNFNARIAILFCTAKYIEDKLTNIPYYLSKTMSYLCNMTRLNISFNHKELIIAELVIIHYLELIT